MTILGYTDSKTECDCGKTGLKGVYVVQTFEGAVLNLGSSCVKKKWDLSASEFTNKVNDAKAIRRSERFDFMEAANAAFNAVATLYPTANKYTPEAAGYAEFMAALNEMKAAQKDCDNKLPLIYTK